MQIELAEPLHRVIQGEGPNIGQKMALMRVSGCPVKCPECDSKQTWHPDFFAKPSVFDVPHLYDEVKHFMQKNQLTTLLISGGEPGLYFKEIAEMIRLNLKDDSGIYGMPFYFEFETTGLYSCEPLIEAYSPHDNDMLHVNFSPKIGSLEKGSNIKRWKAFDEMGDPNKFPKNYSVKIVVDRNHISEDLRAIREFQLKYNIPNNKVYLMPLGVTREQIIKEGPFVLDIAFDNGYNFSPRMHILMFDTKRLV